MSDPPPSKAGRLPDGRFAKGNAANPKGKPVGTRHATTVMAERMLAKDGAAIVRKVVARARAGEAWACKLALEGVVRATTTLLRAT